MFLLTKSPTVTTKQRKVKEYKKSPIHTKITIQNTYFIKKHSILILYEQKNNKKDT